MFFFLHGSHYSISTFIHNLLKSIQNRFENIEVLSNLATSEDDLPQSQPWFKGSDQRSDYFKLQRHAQYQAFGSLSSIVQSKLKKEIYFDIKQIPFLLSLYLTTLHFLEKLDLLKGRNSLLKYLAGFTDLVSNNPGSSDLGLNDKRSNTQQRVKRQRIKMGKIIYVLHKKTIYGPG